MTKDFLLEIGAEEIPARFVPAALEALERLTAARLKEAGLAFKAVKTLGTPRRLTVWVSDLAEKSQDRVEESFGPAVAQAKDGQGHWTPAAQGFARSQGTTPEKLEIRSTPKGDRLCAVKRHEGVFTEKLLPGLVPDLVAGLTFPKSMVWEAGALRFARPIRWITALYGPRPVKCQVAGVKSGRKTYGLLVQSSRPLDVPSPARYAGVLRDRCVIVDPAERRALIEKQILHAVKPLKGLVPLEDHAALLDEVVHLVEHPVAILGRFDGRFLSLPPEVLVTTMKKHQKFFPVFSGSGGETRLLPHFIGIRNGISENQNVVREGYERVLSARLADAAFFYEQDLKTRLEDHGPALGGIAFLAPLTLKDKTDRVGSLAKALARDFRLADADAAEALRIVRLAKTDLVTAVVGEFPELQGVMGRIYASRHETPSVAQGIEQHYWPLTAEGRLPESAAAALAAVADKLDTLAGNFLAGNIPSGSQDPYGLRRAAVGALRILSHRKWRLNLPETVRAALQAYPPGKDAAAAQTALLDFLKQRWSAWMEAQGFRFDEIQAVAAAGFSDVVDLEARLHALQTVRKHPDFDPLATAFKRAANILGQARQKKITFDESAAAPRANGDSAHQALHEAVEKAEREVAPLVDQGRYQEALRSLVQLRAPVDRFFEKVMVMAPEPDVRASRLALLARIAALFHRVGDFSLLQDVPTRQTA